MAHLVSILIPAYNAEKWIGDTIQSALNQTWPRKEIIIVDDGSRDNTLRIARAFESASVKVETQKNRGASAARNHALSLAQGNYIQWLDADDLLAPDKISLQLKYVESSRNERIPLTSSFGVFYYRKEKAAFQPHSLWQDLDPVEWLLRKFNENLWMTPSTWLISRELTERAGPWNEKLTLDDDGEYFCRLVASSEQIMFVKEAKSYYRQWSLGSLSRTKSYDACNSLLLSLTLSIGYLRSLEDSDRTRKASLKLLQTWSHYFYPEKQELVNRMNAFAKELHGELLPPDLGWKYSFIKTILGWQAAKETRDIARKIRLSSSISWDKLMYNLSPK